MDSINRMRGKINAFNCRRAVDVDAETFNFYRTPIHRAIIIHVRRGAGY